MNVPGMVLMILLGGVVTPAAPSQDALVVAPAASPRAVTTTASPQAVTTAASPRAQAVKTAAPSQDALEAAARTVARLWERGDAAGLGALLRPTGVALDLGERSHASLEARQVVASLRDLLGRHASRSVRLDRFSPVDGTPPRAYVEMAWDAVPEGTAEVMRYTVFVGLERVENAWRITEIRILF